MPAIDYTEEWVEVTDPQAALAAVTWAAESRPESFRRSGRLVAHTDTSDTALVIDPCSYIWYERARTCSENVDDSVVPLIVSAANTSTVSQSVLEYIGQVMRGMAERPSADPHYIMSLYESLSDVDATVSEAVGGSIAAALVHDAGSSAYVLPEAASIIDQSGYIDKETAERGYRVLRSEVPRHNRLLDVLARPRAVFGTHDTVAVDTASSVL